MTDIGNCSNVIGEHTDIAIVQSPCRSSPITFPHLPRPVTVKELADNISTIAKASRVKELADN